MKFKTVLIVLGVLGLVALLGGGTVFGATASSAVPSVYVTPVVAPLADTAKITIIGSGFEPGQELKILVKTVDGLWTDIAGNLSPSAIKANDFGAWGTVWTLSDFIKGKLIAEGVNTIFVTDAKYQRLASAPFAFVDTKKPVKEWPSWGSTVLPPPPPAK